ncbi:MAG: hypothetical protein K2L16_00710 [Muribaculaceae bacterium]|nr:hypothetical protein [Muribaculaceae bacterium]
MKARISVLLKFRAFYRLLRHRPYRMSRGEAVRTVFRLSAMHPRISTALIEWYDYGSANYLRYGGVSFRELVEQQNVPPLLAFVELDNLRKKEK